MTGWQDIATAPKSDTRIMLWVERITPQGVAIAYPAFGSWRQWCNGAARWRNDSGGFINATHWQPSPEGPGA